METSSLLRWSWVVVASASLAACVGDPPALELGDPTEVFVAPERGYGGYDGVHAFAMPLATSLSEGVGWEVDAADGALEPWTVPAEFIGSPLASWVVLRVGRAGAMSVTARTAEATAAIALEITRYDPSEIAIGEQRYRSPVDGARPDRAACASCHATAAGHDHSAIHTMFWSDADLLHAIRTGRYRDGTGLGDDHAWDVGPEEARGLIGYLRSLPLER